MGKAQVGRLCEALVRVGLPRLCVVDTLCRELAVAPEIAEAAWAAANEQRSAGVAR